MRAVVVVGSVLDPAGVAVNRRRGRIFVNREEYVMEPADACALEAALRLKDEGDVELVALPRGPSPGGVEDVLRQALAAGADRAIELEGDPFAEADEAAAAGALAAAVEQLGGVDLILTGATTLEAGQGQLGPRLAELLGWPQVVEAWAVRVEGDRVEAVCRAGEGTVWMAAALPAVVTVAAGAMKLRYPEGARLVRVYQDEEAVERRPAAAVAPVVERRGRDFPPPRERGARLEGSAEEAARALAKALQGHLPGRQARG